MTTIAITYRLRTVLCKVGHLDLSGCTVYTIVIAMKNCLCIFVVDI